VGEGQRLVEVGRTREPGQADVERAGQVRDPAQGKGPAIDVRVDDRTGRGLQDLRSEEHTSELQSRENLVCRLLLEKKKKDGADSGARQKGELVELSGGKRPRVAQHSVFRNYSAFHHVSGRWDERGLHVLRSADRGR